MSSMMTRQDLEQVVVGDDFSMDVAIGVVDAIWAAMKPTRVLHTDGEGDIQFDKHCLGEAVRVLVLSDKPEHLNTRVARFLRTAANSEGFADIEARGLAEELDRAVEEASGE